jgi:hypothetical protein
LFPFVLCEEERKSVALYPAIPVPSSTSAPAIIDPILSFQTDSGIETRRALHSRPLRRYTLEYLGKNTQEMRVIRDFLQACRFGAAETIQWAHASAFDTVPFSNTTPIILTYYHGLVTGQWVNIGSPAGLAGAWRITRLNSTEIALQGTSSGGGTGQCTVQQYLAHAVARFSDDTMPEPTKLIGPEGILITGNSTGFFNFSVSLEEVF